MRKLIRITQEDIDIGKREDASDCPAALAIAREFPQYDIHVFETTTTLCDNPGARIYDGHFHHWADNSERLQGFISRFDTGREVKPINFYLNVPG